MTNGLPFNAEGDWYVSLVILNSYSFFQLRIIWKGIHTLQHDTLELFYSAFPWIPYIVTTGDRRCNEIHTR